MREELDGRLEQKQISKATRGRVKQSDSRNASESVEKRKTLRTQGEAYPVGGSTVGQGGGERRLW